MRRIQMPDSGVPIVVTYRRYLRSPKLKRHRRFVGPVQFVKNLLAKTIDMIEEAAFETQIEHVDPGQSVSANWAITVGDPFNPDPEAGRQALVAYRLGKDIPPAGVTFEVITPAPKKQQRPDHEEHHGHGHSHGEDPVDLSPEQFTALQRRREQAALLSEGQGPNGRFRPPPAPEYGPRRVKTIDEELAEGAVADEDAEDLLDGADSEV